MLTHVLLGVTPIVYSLAYVDSSQHTSEGTKNMAQYASVTLEEITNEVNDKFCKFPSMRLYKMNVASC